MALSGWCSEFGRGHHSSCRAEVCECPCHVGETPPIRTLYLPGSEPAKWDNRDAPAGCVNTAARADRTPLADKESG